MALLILIALAQLAVLVLLLGAVSQLADEKSARQRAESAVQDIERQTLRAMFLASDAASLEVLPQNKHQ